MVHKIDSGNGKTYKILRFYEDGRTAKVIATGMSLEQAQTHCSDPRTHGKGWFDGYTAEQDDTEEY